MANAFRLTKKTGNASVFAGTAVEFMKTMFYGTKGHIGFATNSMTRALEYFKANNIEVIEDRICKDDSGKLVPAYLKNEIGGGDSFGAGLIYAMNAGFDAQQMIEYAAAASCLKQTIELDMNLSKCEDVLALVNGDG